jgi:hypothetical protein
MKSAQAAEVAIRIKRPVLASPRTTAIGLWLTAFGIFIQTASGAAGYPKIPPGIILLAAVGLAVYMTSRHRWASLLGVLLAGFISIGVFTTHGTGYRLSHPEDVGPLIGTLMQLLGLMIALLAGVASTMRSYLPGRH